MADPVVRFFSNSLNQQTPRICQSDFLKDASSEILVDIA